MCTTLEAVAAAIRLKINEKKSKYLLTYNNKQTVNSTYIQISV